MAPCDAVLAVALSRRRAASHGAGNSKEATRGAGGFGAEGAGKNGQRSGDLDLDLRSFGSLFTKTSFPVPIANSKRSPLNFVRLGPEANFILQTPGTIATAIVHS